MNSIINNSVVGHSDLINTTMTSERDNITGFYFYNSVKRAWFIVVQSNYVYSSLNMAFGYRWPKKHHNIIKSRQVTAKKAQFINDCSNQQFHKIKA